MNKLEHWCMYIKLLESLPNAKIGKSKKCCFFLKSLQILVFKFNTFSFEKNLVFFSDIFHNRKWF